MPIRGADLVDPYDPDFGAISRAALALERYGFDLSDPDIAARAVMVGRQAAAEERGIFPDRDIPERPSSPESRSDPVVYYMRIGNRIKIGWTRDIATRTASLNPEELLATEPGGPELERQRHNEFADLHTHGEWFQMAEPLIAHIVELNQAA